MKDYLICLLAFSAVCSIAVLFTPEGEGGGLKKHVCMLCALCMLSLIISSIMKLNFSTDLSEYDISQREEYESIFENTKNDASGMSVKDSVNEILLNRFGIEREDCTVSVKYKDNTKPYLIYICFYGSAVWKNTNEIRAYLQELFECEIVIAIGREEE